MSAALTTATNTLGTQFASLAARARHSGAVAWGSTSRACGRGLHALRRAGRWTAVVTRRGLVTTLRAMERPLLSPKGREWVHATSVFALIFAFAVSSVDMLITGGPELIGSARAASPPSARIDLIAATSLPRDGTIQLAAVEDQPAPPAIVEPVVMIAPEALPRAEVIPVADLRDGPVKADGDETVAAASAAEEKAKGEDQA